MGLVSIERSEADGLTKKTWEFIALDNMANAAVALYVERYAELSRPTKRHAFRVSGKAFYDRTGRRYFGETSDYGHATVPIPDDVRDEALHLYRMRVAVMRWSGS